MTDQLKVLIPVDFSETSRRALAWAFDYAMRAPCELHVLHVVEEHLGDVLGKPDAIGSELAAVIKQTQGELRRMVPDREERAHAQTPNPKPQTPNPKPQTPNPE